MIYDVQQFGAIADGKTNCAKAIQAAVDKAYQAGGGRVLLPTGRYLSGSILLKSNVELHLEAGAVLISSLEEADILPFPADPSEGEVDGWNGGFFLGARDAENITLSGQGVIDGQGDRVFVDADVDSGFHECPLRVAAFRPRMILFENVRNLTVADITLKDAAFWTLHMAGCRHVRIHDIRILNNDRGANNDGIDPDCCQDVVISNCIVHTGDD
ncbi:MAG: glycoside hydrolase family 28 protein, partial [Clostridia bacterium]|nr:glycoside hydrolase family 28 protein [Clostridia bacterium]